MQRSVHVIGAGLAGLSAAIRLAERGERVVLHEAAGQAGGRCRSYHDPALDMVIDNGNHLVLSGNQAALSYLRALGAEDRLSGPATADFEFMDLATRERWTLRINDGSVPWWVFDAHRRPPGTRVRDYLPLARFLSAPRDKSVGDIVACKGPVYDRLLHPLLLAALNTEPATGSAHLAGTIVRETVLAGGQACRPLVAHDGLGHAFVEPAMQFFQDREIPVCFGHRLRAITFGQGRAEALDFGDETVQLGADDAVVLTVPPQVAAALVPDLQAPNDFRAIVNAHFRIAPPPGLAPMTGVLNGTIEWLFAFPDRLSITISASDRLLETPRETLAATIWKDVAAVAGMTDPLPRWQIVRERRATFAATPAQDARRPGPRTAWKNLVLAGDWTDTGLPATIEGAIRSGDLAARVVAGASDE